MGHKRSLQLSSEPRVRTTAVSDNTGLAEVGGKPGKRRGTFKTPAFRRSGCRTIAEMISIQWPLFADQRGLKRQHQARLGQPCVQTIRKFLSWHQGLELWNSTPEKTGQNGHGRGFHRQFTGSRLQKTDLTTMGVEQHQALHTLLRELLANFFHEANQQFSAEAECSWKAAMFR